MRAFHRTSIRTLLAVGLAQIAVRSCLAQPYTPPDTLWTKVLPTSEIGFVYPEDMVGLDDGSSLISGFFEFDHPATEHLFVMKLDSLGNLIWQSWYGDTVESAYSSGQMCRTGSNRLVLIGMRVGIDADLYAVYLDLDGNVIWQRSWPMPGFQWAHSVCAGEDGSFLVAYQTPNPMAIYGSAGWMKVNALGDSVWTGTYDEPLYASDAGAAAPTDDGGFVIGGFTNINNEYGQVLLIKVDPAGNIEFSRTYMLYTSVDIRGIAVTSNGYILCGVTRDYSDFSNPFQPYVLALNEQGDSLWWWTDPEPFDGYGIAVKVIETADSGFMVLCQTVYVAEGSSGGAATVVRLDRNGQELWTQTYTLAHPPFRSLLLQRCFEMDGNGRCTIAGGCRRYDSNDESFGMIQTAPDPVLSVDNIHFVGIPAQIELNVFPNPFNAATRLSFSLPQRDMVSLDLFDVLGGHVQSLSSGQREAGTHVVQVSGENLSSGIYFARLSGTGYASTAKLVLLK